VPDEFIEEGRLLGPLPREVALDQQRRESHRPYRQLAYCQAVWQRCVGALFEDAARLARFIRTAASRGFGWRAAP
jgi:hypothetical protein